MKQKKKKRPITLLEIMIVVFLIGIIASVLGYNMKGSLDKGRAFKTEQAMRQVYDILQLEIANGYTAEEVAADPVTYIKRAGLSKNPKELLKDGWNVPLVISAKGHSDLHISSEKLRDYNKKHGKKKDSEEQDENADSNE